MKNNESGVEQLRENGVNERKDRSNEGKRIEAKEKE